MAKTSTERVREWRARHPEHKQQEREYRQRNAAEIAVKRHERYLRWKEARLKAERESVCGDVED